MLYIHNNDATSVVMDFTLTDEQQLLKESVREFCDREIVPRLRDMIKDRRIPSEIYSGLGKLGLLGMTVSEKYGGMGADALTTGIVAEEIARADPTASIPVLFLVDNAWSYLISKYGSDELKEDLLPKVTRGKAIVGIASTEPNFGSDISSMTSYATREGNEYIATGEKSYISLIRDVKEIGGGFVTVLKTKKDAGTKGVSLIFMPLESSFSVSYIEEMGREGSSWGSFSFNDFHVPGTNLIGKENEGFKIIHEGFELARGLISLICVSSASSSIERAVAYMKGRVAFHRPIATYQGLQFQLADDVAKLEAARQLSYKALWMYDHEQRKEKFTRMDVSKEIAMAKLVSTTVAFDSINDALQWEGAYGYSKDSPEEWAFRAIRSFQLAEGSREIMKVIISRETLGREFM